MPKPKRRPPRFALLAHLRRHLKVDPATLPVLEQTFSLYERPNLHLAIEELLRQTQATFRPVIRADDQSS